MKKSELEEAYRELQYRCNKLHSDTRKEIEELKRVNAVNLKNAKTDAEDKAYEAMIDYLMSGKKIVDRTGQSYQFVDGAIEFVYEVYDAIDMIHKYIKKICHA